MKLISLLISCILSSVALFGEVLSIDAVMTPEEKKNTGVEGLSPEKRVQLEAWLATFTKKVLTQAPTYRDPENLTDWIRRWPDTIRPNAQIAPQEKAQELQRQNMKIFRVYENGKKLELYDGSLWLITPGEAGYVARWSRDDIIEATETGSASPEWFLWNATKKARAGASKLRDANLSGQRKEDAPDYFKGAQLITQLESRGKELTLADGTTWKITAKHQVLVRAWRPGDRVRSEKNSTDLLFPYTLTNLDRGITVQALQK